MLHLLTINGWNASWFEAFATREACDAHLWKWAHECLGNEGETLEAFRARFADDVADAMSATDAGWEVIEVSAADARAKIASVNEARIYSLVIDNDDGAELHMFRSEAELNAHLWEYAFNNSDTDAESLESFKAECDGDLGEAMERTGDGYQYEWMTI